MDQTITPNTPQTSINSTFTPPPTKKPISKLLPALFLFIVFVVSYLYFSQTKKLDTTTQDKTSADSTSTFSIDATYQFAPFEMTSTSFIPKVDSYTLGLNDLSNLSDFETQDNLTSDQLQALQDNHFFVSKNLDTFYSQNPDDPVIRSDDWTALYEDIGGINRVDKRYPQNSVFVTTDYLLHIYHRLLENEFEYIEQTQFYPILSDMTNNLLNQALTNYQVATSESDKQSLERLIAFFAVPKVILDSAKTEFDQANFEDQKLDTSQNILANLDALKSKLPQISYQNAQKEIDLILKGTNPDISPIFADSSIQKGLAFVHDYTQYTPRSHYNKNSILRTYFRAMMWFGRVDYRTNNLDLTRDALNIVNLIQQTNSTESWQKIYDPTSFFVGQSDDLGIYQYSQILKDLGIDKFPLTDDQVSLVQKETDKYQGPQIMSSIIFGDPVFDTSKQDLQEETKSFRFMGQRFTPDAFIFSSLTQGDEAPDPETGQKLPSTPTALMVMSVLGNNTAKPFLDNWISQNALESDKVIAKFMNLLSDTFAKTDQSIWTQNIYWGWLYTIKSLFDYPSSTQGYPVFMTKDLWQRKNLAASLGSWTELKHDTLLYAKQSYAELGGGSELGDPLPIPKGYVEPNIEFFDRLLALSNMTYQGLNSRELLDPSFSGKNDKFIESLQFFKDIAVKQLQNETITDEEFEKLRLLPGQLDYVVMPLPGAQAIEDNARSALIADVHTDAKLGQILYQANGIPNYIYVAVKDQNGTRLTKGLVFSYYEFTNPLGKRLTDQDWRQINYTQDKSQLPSAPVWLDDLVR